MPFPDYVAIGTASVRPAPLSSDARDWVTVELNALRAESAWDAEPDIKAFIQASRLHILRGLEARTDDPQLQTAMATIAQDGRPAIENLQRLDAACGSAS
jgi:hypothetical protein